jgi:hypothetical protein
MLDMAQLAFEAGGAARRTAMVLDVRSRAFSTDLAGRSARSRSAASRRGWCSSTPTTRC